MKKSLLLPSKCASAYDNLELLGFLDNRPVLQPPKDLIQSAGSPVAKPEMKKVDAEKVGGALDYDKKKVIIINKKDYKLLPLNSTDLEKFNLPSSLLNKQIKAGDNVPGTRHVGGDNAYQSSNSINSEGKSQEVSKNDAGDFSESNVERVSAVPRRKKARMNKTKHFKQKNQKGVTKKVSKQLKKIKQIKRNKRELLRKEIEQYLRMKRKKLLKRKRSTIGCQTENAGNDSQMQIDTLVESSQLNHTNDCTIFNHTKDDGTIFNEINDHDTLFELAQKIIGSPTSLIRDVNFGVGPTMQQVSANRSADPKMMLFYKTLKDCVVPDDGGGNIPLHIAVLHNNHPEVKRQCQMLKIRNASVDALNMSGYTPLHLAIMNSCDNELIETLLTSGADPFAKDDEGNTPIHLAVTCDARKTLVLLLEVAKRSGTSIDVFNYEGFTPLMICVLDDKYDLAYTLLNYGANPDTKDLKSGRTSLFHAVENDNVALVTLFMAKGANTKIKNFFGTSTHEATFELENLSAEIKNLVIGRDTIVSRAKVDRLKNTKEREKPVEKRAPYYFIDRPNHIKKLKTVRILKIINNND